jgi:hypothetical protein
LNTEPRSSIYSVRFKFSLRSNASSIRAPLPDLDPFSARIAVRTKLSRFAIGRVVRFGLVAFLAIVCVVQRRERFLDRFEKRQEARQRPCGSVGGIPADTCEHSPSRCAVPRLHPLHGERCQLAAKPVFKPGP